MPRTAIYWLVAAYAMLVPAMVALAVLPTPSSDTREAYAWGHFFTLETIKHPPMMQWIAGLTERLLAPSAFSAILVTQTLSSAGLLYVFATLRLCIDRQRAAMFTFLFATSVYFTAAPLAFALNADVLQVVSWAGVIYHALRSIQTNRLSHWLALALWSAAAIYTKYTAAVLFVSLGMASLWVADYRIIWRSPRFYGALLTSTLLVIPLMAAIWSRQGSISHAETLIYWAMPMDEKLKNLAQIPLGLLLYLLPGWIIVAIGLVRQDCRFSTSKDGMKPINRFLGATAGAAFAILIALVLGAGLRFESRYDGPFLILAVLAIAPWLEFKSELWPTIERRVMAVAAGVSTAILVGVSGLFGLITSHQYMQEPTTQATDVIRKAWSAQFGCGPAYILGDVWSANGLALTGNPLPIGIPLEVLDSVSWYDPALLLRSGAIVVYRNSVDTGELARSLPWVTNPQIQTLTLPLLRSYRGATITYSYFFMPPKECPAPVQG